MGSPDGPAGSGCRYGTLICDLERRRTIALLADREPATTQAWLEQPPQVSIVYSLMLTCRACSIEPLAWPRHVLTELSRRAAEADINDLLPFNIRQNQGRLTNPGTVMARKGPQRAEK